MEKESSLEKKIDALTSIVEKGFAALAEDMSEMKNAMATKDHVIALQAQNNSIETELRTMKYTKLLGRVADLEEETFGEVRA